MRICGAENIIWHANTTLVASSEDIAHPVTNIRHQWPSKTWRSEVSMASQFVRIAPGVPTAASMLCLKNVGLHTGGLLYFSGITNPTTYTDLGIIQFPSFNPSGVIVHPISAPTTPFDRFELFWENVASVDEAASLGVAYIGTPTLFPAALSREYEVAADNPSVVLESRGGQATDDDRDDRYAITGALVPLNTDDRNRLWQIRAAVRRRPVFVLFSDTDPVKQIYAPLTTQGAAVYTPYQHWVHEFSLVEAK